MTRQALQLFADRVGRPIQQRRGDVAVVPVNGWEIVNETGSYDAWFSGNLGEKRLPFPNLTLDQALDVVSAPPSVEMVDALDAQKTDPVHWAKLRAEGALADPLPECPNAENHTPHPEAAEATTEMEWENAMRQKTKTHKQTKCPGCGRGVIWVPRDQPGTRRKS